MPFAGWIQIFSYCAYCEISAGYDADVNKRTPGDMGWNPPLFSGNDPETKKRRLNAELANGRLAMMATIGMFFQAQLFCRTCFVQMNMTCFVLPGDLTRIDKEKKCL